MTLISDTYYYLHLILQGASRISSGVYRTVVHTVVSPTPDYTQLRDFYSKNNSGPPHSTSEYYSTAVMLKTSIDDR